MNLRLLRNEIPIDLTAERDGDKLLVTHDGANHRYEVTALGSNEYIIRNAHSLVRVTAIKTKNKIYVLTDNESHVFDLPGSKDADTFGGDHGDHGDKSKISAPMPGKVVKVLVKAGDKVEPKQKLLVVEAMKMENPLVAPFKGEVKSVNCAEGELVDSEKTLVELIKSE